ncbi:CAP domain-containing protein [uncultured Litoreibacter sp.]|uniref:CAP domain-containing protein n=1 Tax=uncultured Litoreibacter sp. TaxID=1392394 RepID=UPI00261972F0|nr:CAP domain-containing protein [uncultured Litoreibacter sp.]
MTLKIWMTLIVTGLMAGCTPEEPAKVAPPAHVSASAVSQDEVGSLLNTERAKQGLHALTMNPKLAAAARVHAQDMARAGFFSHTGSDGSMPADRVRAQGYGFCFVAENIAQGQPTAGQVMQAWMDSQGHRRNNLSSAARDYGAANAQGDYWVLVFGASGC